MKRQTKFIFVTAGVLADAADQVLGRLSTRLGTVLRGKHYSKR